MINLNKRKNCDITIHFNIEDKDKALVCYRIFYSHYTDRINLNETFLSDQNIRIHYELKDFSKIQIYDGLFQKINFKTNPNSQKL